MRPPPPQPTSTLSHSVRSACSFSRSFCCSGVPPLPLCFASSSSLMRRWRLMYSTILSCSSCTCALRSASSGRDGRLTLPLICGRARGVRGASAGGRVFGAAAAVRARRPAGGGGAAAGGGSGRLAAAAGPGACGAAGGCTSLPSRPRGCCGGGGDAGWACRAAPRCGCARPRRARADRGGGRARRPMRPPPHPDQQALVNGDLRQVLPLARRRLARRGGRILGGLLGRGRRDGLLHGGHGFKRGTPTRSADHGARRGGGAAGGRGRRRGRRARARSVAGVVSFDGGSAPRRVRPGGRDGGGRPREQEAARCGRPAPSRPAPRPVQPGPRRPAVVASLSRFVCTGSAPKPPSTHLWHDL
jgi:hypothetical protein